MNRSLRFFAGCLCIAAGFALVILIGLGVFDPITASAAKATSLTPALVAMLPGVTFGIALFAVGVWLIATGKSK